MRIVFRADASREIGTGHVMRCLTLADALRERGARCIFICREHKGNLIDLIAQHGHKVHSLPQTAREVKPEDSDLAHASWLGTGQETDATDTLHELGEGVVDWIIVDHYALDHRWEQALRPSCKQIMVIDDLADRRHDCDLLLDQNLGRSEQDYRGLVTSNTRMMIGPQYALLRPEFAQWREYSLGRRDHPQLQSLLITMGGVDKGNATGQVLDALKSCELSPDLHINVVMGSNAPWLTDVQQQAAHMPCPTKVLTGINNMAQLMADSDLAIGAAGSTSWERCCMGLPALLLVLADNQRDIARKLDRLGAAFLVKEPGTLSKEIKRGLKWILSDNHFADMSTTASELVDGLGVRRVIEHMGQST